MNEKKFEAQSEQKQYRAPDKLQETVILHPKTDIVENKDEIIILSEMPGVEEKDVHVSFEGNVITITGDVNLSQYAGKCDNANEEMISGKYERSFSILSEINVDKITAKIKDGVLKVILPKSEKIKPKKIEVKVE